LLLSAFLKFEDLGAVGSIIVSAPVIVTQEEVTVIHTVIHYAAVTKTNTHLLYAHTNTVTNAITNTVTNAHTNTVTNAITNTVIYTNFTYTNPQVIEIINEVVPKFPETDVPLSAQRDSDSAAAVYLCDVEGGGFAYQEVMVYTLCY
jgi:hypothetical protein